MALFRRPILVAVLSAFIAAVAFLAACGNEGTVTIGEIKQLPNEDDIEVTVGEIKELTDEFSVGDITFIPDPGSVAVSLRVKEQSPPNFLHTIRFDAVAQVPAPRTFPGPSRLPNTERTVRATGTGDYHEQSDLIAPGPCETNVKKYGPAEMVVVVQLDIHEVNVRLRGQLGRVDVQSGDPCPVSYTGVNDGTSPYDGCDFFDVDLERGGLFKMTPPRVSPGEYEFECTLFFAPWDPSRTPTPRPTAVPTPGPRATPSIPGAPGCPSPTPKAGTCLTPTSRP